MPKSFITRIPLVLDVSLGDTKGLLRVLQEAEKMHLVTEYVLRALNSFANHTGSYVFDRKELARLEKVDSGGVISPICEYPGFRLRRLDKKEREQLNSKSFHLISGALVFPETYSELNFNLQRVLLGDSVEARLDYISEGGFFPSKNYSLRGIKLMRVGYNITPIPAMIQTMQERGSEIKPFLTSEDMKTADSS